MIRFRLAQPTDLDLYFKWANEEHTRRNSYSPGKIPYATHVSWFNSKLQDPNTIFLVFEYEKSGIPIGQVLFDRKENENFIRISIDKDFRGRLLATSMVQEACNYYFEQYPADTISAYIKKDNMASVKAFQHAGFELLSELEFKGFPSFVYTKKKQ
ncbi:GNAT family N-acetyltransferase [Solitalea koreensis]|uniref:Protein N-acetyltransferase, RimJ/RimL family n=1 Tax=Solitalea koreensis TaxID=543615 RepID=A0A521CPM3_9SPHI|nr:GNAT family N-acetyltransferase [Solitalea koreensis]SMO60630.1 Protein N-acetyltransferase, RimJ/RimL family [Solitalea koreensis]